MVSGENRMKIKVKTLSAPFVQKASTSMKLKAENSHVI